MRPALATAALGVTFALAAALMDVEPLWVPAVALVALAAGSAAWVTFGAGGVGVVRSLGSRRVMENEPLSIVVEVSAQRGALPPARLVDPLLPGGSVPLHAASRGTRVRIEARFGRRGRRALARPRVIVADPLGLATRSIEARPSETGDEVLVLPRIEPVTFSEGGGDRARVVRRGRPVVGAEVELDGIRPLREGTPAARIFWPAIARGAEPQERFLPATSTSEPLIVLDPRGAASDEALDAAVRATASLAHALARAGGCSVLLPGDRHPIALGETLAGWPHVHARLAVLGPNGAPSMASVASRSGPVIFVSARMRARMPPALGPSHGAARTLVVPGQLPGRRAAFAVAGCAGYLLTGARHAGLRRSA